MIWSFEHDAWWRPGRWGYTRELAEAGHYTKAEADQIVAKANVITVNEQAMPLEAAAQFSPPPSWCCLKCRRRSFNSHDIRELYCGACHAFLAEQLPLPIDLVEGLARAVASAIVVTIRRDDGKKTDQ